MDEPRSDPRGSLGSKLFGRIGSDRRSIAWIERIDDPQHQQKYTYFHDYQGGKLVPLGAQCPKMTNFDVLGLKMCTFGLKCGKFGRKMGKFEFKKGQIWTKMGKFGRKRGKSEARGSLEVRSSKVRKSKVRIARRSIPKRFIHPY